MVLVTIDELKQCKRALVVLSEAHKRQQGSNLVKPETRADLDQLHALLWRIERGMQKRTIHRSEGKKAP